MGNCLKMTDKRRILALLELGWPYRRIAQPVDGWHAVGTRPGATRGQPDGPARSLGATSLGEYLVPVYADAPDVTVEFVGVRDDVVNPLGVRFNRLYPQEYVRTAITEVGRIGSTLRAPR